MKFSVLIPAYNCSVTIGDTVRSLLRSGLDDYEVILINDGSTDDTATKLAQITEKYANVVALTKPNGGVSSARNLGIQTARGEYLVFVDADDQLPEAAYRHVVEIVEREQPDMLMFGVQFEHYYKKFLYQTEQMVCTTSGLLDSKEVNKMLMDLFQCNYLSPIWNKIIRRDLIEKHQIRFAESMMLMEDCLFSLECLQHCQTVYLHPEAIYHYALFEGDNKLEKRLRRVGNLYEYIKHFSDLPAEHAAVVQRIYYMLLSQRIGFDRTVPQLNAEADDLKKSGFGENLSSAPGVLKLLNAGQYRRILSDNRKRRIRHRAAVLYKTVRSLCRQPQIPNE